MAWSGSQPSTREVISVTAAKPMLVLNPGLGYFAILLLSIPFHYCLCISEIEKSRRVQVIYLFMYELNIFIQGRTYRKNHCFTMLPCTE